MQRIARKKGGEIKMSELEKQLNNVLGEEKTKAVMQDLALVIAKHNLVKSPEICKMLFDYMVVVTEGWQEPETIYRVYAGAGRPPTTFLERKELADTLRNVLAEQVSQRSENAIKPDDIEKSRMNRRLSFFLDGLESFRLYFWPLYVFDIITIIVLGFLIQG